MAFRFENLEIWQRAFEVADRLCDIADHLEQAQRYRFAEQVRSAAMSMPNNIAEGSGSTHSREFYQFLNIARRSAFECASAVAILSRRQHIAELDKVQLTSELDELCRMITAFMQTLERGKLGK